MKRLRRTLSFRKPEGHIPESCRPHVWEQDSQKVRSGGVSFPVKYLGCLEVNESRGTQVCAEAARQLKALSSAKKKRMTLLVTSECVRLIDEETKSLAVDQTIEKVSFCTPDPNNERLFSYISRDGTTRRWMCHSFLAVRDTGERISHAVGCAFTACLQRKQKAMAAQQIAEQQQKTAGGVTSSPPKTTGSLSPTSSQTTTAKSGTVSVTPSSSSSSVQQPTAMSTVQGNSPAPSPPYSKQQSQPNETPPQWQQSNIDNEWDALTQGISALSNGPSALPPIPQSPVSSPPVSTQQALSPPPPAATRGVTTAGASTASSNLSGIARRRPVPFNPSPFTRHLSLRTKANPLTLAPLKETSGKYETLAEENTPPRLQTTAGGDIQPRQATQPQQAQNIQVFAPASNTITSQSSSITSVHEQQDPFTQLRPLQTNIAPQNLNQQGVFMQNNAISSNMWPQSSGGLKPLPLNQPSASAEDMWTAKGQQTVRAEQWLASAQRVGTDVSSQGILTPKNPFSMSQNGMNGMTALSNNTWNSNTQNGNADEFTSLAERHVSPTSPTAGIGSNPFKQDILWV